MTPSTSRALVFMTGRNCSAYIEAAVASVARQSHTSTHVLFVDDASTDDTAAVAQRTLRATLPGRHTFISNRQQWGKARNTSVHLRGALELGDFVAVLDADDRLIEDDVLAEMSHSYGQGFDVVWSNYQTDQGHVGGNRQLDPFSTPRTQGWVTSHFFSFRSELLTAVGPEYFQDSEGRWLQSACDFALAYPILDQTRRYAYLPRTAYQYTQTNPLSFHNQDKASAGLSSRRQQADAATVLAKKPLPCSRFATEVPAVLQAALSHRFAAFDSALRSLGGAMGKLQSTVERAPFVQRAVQGLEQEEGIPLSWISDVGGWALDAEFLHHLRGVLDQYENPRVLEFGSGRGSKVLARLCANRGGSLISLEHDAAWHAMTTRELAKHDLSSTATTKLCPLEDVEFHGTPGRFYDMSWLTPEDTFDVVIVDGPPTVTSTLARLPALPSIASNLSPKGFDVFLDDFERQAEKRIVDIWKKVAPDLRYETLVFDKEVCAISA